MEKDFRREKGRKYEKLEKQAGLMTLNRQVDYGYRGTTPNYVLNLPKTPLTKGSKEIL